MADKKAMPPKSACVNETLAKPESFNAALTATLKGHGDGNSWEAGEDQLPGNPYGPDGMPKE